MCCFFVIWRRCSSYIMAVWLPGCNHPSGVSIRFVLTCRFPWRNIPLLKGTMSVLELNQTRVNMKHSKKKLSIHVKICQGNDFADEVLSANLAFLFIFYVWMHYVEVIKWGPAFKSPSLTKMFHFYYSKFNKYPLYISRFLLPPESGEKVTLGLSVLLTITVFMLMVADKMPQTSESVSLISRHFVACLLSRHFIACLISRHFIACLISRHFITCLISRHFVACLISRHFIACLISRHFLMTNK